MRQHLAMAIVVATVKREFCFGGIVSIEAMKGEEIPVYALAWESMSGRIERLEHLQNLIEKAQLLWTEFGHVAHCMWRHSESLFPHQFDSASIAGT